VPARVRVLGVDPGSAAAGWALVTSDGRHHLLEDAGVIRPCGDGRAERLADLVRRLSDLVTSRAPDCAAVESSFAGRNPRSSLSLAESRGVVLAVLGQGGIPVYSYTPAQVKSAIVGHGRAEKRQIVYMVVRLLGLEKRPAQDAADAMAVALTHLHTSLWK